MTWVWANESRWCSRVIAIDICCTLLCCCCWRVAICEMNRQREFLKMKIIWLCSMSQQEQIRSRHRVQIDLVVDRQNQILEHYSRNFVDVEQASWVNLLSIAKYVYNNSQHISTNVSSFYLMYEYNLEIYYDVENNVSQERVSFAKERV